MYITKIKLHNFRRFKNLDITFKKGRNILVGDNESGKSSVLQAIDLAARGSVHRVEDIGIETLFNVDAVSSFMSGERKVENLPNLFVELYLADVVDEGLDGRNNSDGRITNGVRMTIEPNPDLSRITQEVIQSADTSFPYEFYSITFSTFSGDSYNGYTKKVKTVFLDNSTIGNEYAMNDYISTIYNATLSPLEQLTTKHKYGSIKDGFKGNVLAAFSGKLNNGFSFSIKNTGKNCLEYDLNIEKDGVSITEKGRGIQCMVKTQLALNKAQDIPIIMIEEPECHLSQLHMRQLIDSIERDAVSQIFITTHSDLISTRLNLKNCILMNSSTPSQTMGLDFVEVNTAEFFMKAPDNNMLQFVLSKKVILVEGDAEFILMDTFCKQVLTQSLSDLGIEVIAVDGKCFKRYLEIAKVLGMRVAVLTDNDKNYAENITAAYQDYMNNEFDNIKVFSDQDNNRYTFEVVLYNENKKECDALFGAGRRTLTVQEYMLANKAEAAFKLLSEKSETIQTPPYIREALVWINA